MSGPGMSNGLSNGLHDVQLPEDPAAQATLDFSTALRPGALPMPPAASPPDAARASTPVASSSAFAMPPLAVPNPSGAPTYGRVAPSAPVRLYGQELGVPRAAPMDRDSIHASMGRGLDALAWPAPAPLWDRSSAVRVAPSAFAHPYESEPRSLEDGEDKRAAYGFDGDDRLSALAQSEASAGSDWSAVYGLGDAPESLDWASLESDDALDGSEDEEEEDDLYEEASASLRDDASDDAPPLVALAALEDELADELRARFAEPKSNLDAVFDAEPEPDAACCGDEGDEELTASLGEAFEEAERPSERSGDSGLALSLEDLDRMFDEDFVSSR